MTHTVTHKLTQQVKNVELELQIKAPIETNVDIFIDRVQALFRQVRVNPNQLGLDFEGNETTEDLTETSAATV